MKTLIILITFVGLLAVLQGCSAAESQFADAASPATTGAMTQASNTDGAKTAASPLLKNRFVIRNADLTVQVEDAEKADKAAQAVVEKAGGYVESAQATGMGGSDPSVEMKVRVPVERFEDVLDGLGGLGVVQTKGISSEDVTGDIVDLDARLKTLSAKEEVLTGMLKKASKTNDLIQLESSLTEVRTQIEQIAGQRAALAGQAKYSTISLTLEQKASLVVPAKDQNWSQAAWTESTASLGAFGRTLGTIGIWLLTFSPVLLGVALAVVLMVQVAKRIPTGKKSANLTNQPPVNR